MKNFFIASALVMMALASNASEPAQITVKCGLGLRVYDTQSQQAIYMDLTPASVQEQAVSIPKPMMPIPGGNMESAPAIRFKFSANTPDGLISVNAMVDGNSLGTGGGRVEFMDYMSVSITKDDMVIQNMSEQTRINLADPDLFLNPELRTAGVQFSKNVSSTNSSPRQYFANCVYHLKKAPSASN